MEKVSIKDLYASDDFIAGLQAGKKLPAQAIYKIKTESRNPISIDKFNWIYIDKKNIILVHEVYDREKYIRTDAIKIPKRLFF